MQQYCELLDTVDVVIQGSLVPLEFSPAIAWWYNEWAEKGRTPSGAASNLAQYVDLLVPMAYGTPNATTVSTRVADELSAAPTLVGLKADDFADRDAPAAATRALGASSSGQSNYLGFCVFRYGTLKALGRSDGVTTEVNGFVGGSDGYVGIYNNETLRVGAPGDHALLQNTPNPFSPCTSIRYALPEEERVALVVYNAGGQRLRTLVDGTQYAGWHEVTWNGRDSGGRLVGPGVYVVLMRTERSFEIRKMVKVE